MFFSRLCLRLDLGKDLKEMCTPDSVTSKIEVTVGYRPAPYEDMTTSGYFQDGQQPRTHIKFSKCNFQQRLARDSLEISG